VKSLSARLERTDAAPALRPNRSGEILNEGFGTSIDDIIIDPNARSMFTVFESWTRSAHGVWKYYAHSMQRLVRKFTLAD
jgi:hypothetical protein